MMIDMTTFHGTAAGGAVRPRLGEALCGGWLPVNWAHSADQGLDRRGLLYGGVIAPTSKTFRGTALPAAVRSVVTT